jgi:hypothetical protein
MSYVDSSNNRLISSAEDVIDAYCCADKKSMTGVEVELAYFKPTDTDIRLPTQAENKAIMAALQSQYGEKAFNNEPSTDFVEANSIPAPFDALNTVFDDIDAKIAAADEEAAKHSLKRSPFQDLPTATYDDYLNNIVDVPRYQAFFNPPRADMMDIAHYFTATKSTQVSVSYKNYQHMFENVRRLYLLAPFFFILTDNGSGYKNGERFKGHSGMFHRRSLKDRGGFPSYVFTSQNGEEYIHAHIHHVMNNPMYVYYDQSGEIVRLPSGTWWTFDKDLRDKGLNTAANYFLAQSILWPDVKIAPLMNDDGQVTHHRYEARMFGVGSHQHYDALLLVATLAYDADFAKAVDTLLANYGLCTSDCDNCIKRLQNAYNAACFHDDKFMNIPYGTGYMNNFAKEFGDLFANSKAARDYIEHISPILEICESGVTDTERNVKN